MTSTYSGSFSYIYKEGISGTGTFTDETWVIWKSLVDTVRPHGETSPRDLRRTIAATFWRHKNGAKWRSWRPAKTGSVWTPMVIH